MALNEATYKRVKEIRLKLYEGRASFKLLSEEEQGLLIEAVNHDADWARMSRELEDE